MEEVGESLIRSESELNDATGVMDSSSDFIGVECLGV